MGIKVTNPPQVLQEPYQLKIPSSTSSSFASTKIEYDDKYVYIAKFKLPKNKQLDNKSYLDLGCSFIDVNQRAYVRDVQPGSGPYMAGVAHKDRLEFAFLSRQTRILKKSENQDEDEDVDDDDDEDDDNQVYDVAKAKAAIHMERQGSRTTFDDLREMLQVAKIYGSSVLLNHKRRSSIGEMLSEATNDFMDSTCWHSDSKIKTDTQVNEVFATDGKNNHAFDIYTITFVFKKAKQSRQDCSSCNQGLNQVDTWFDLVFCVTGC